MPERGMLWSVMQQGGRQAANYLVFIVLAVLLTPIDFGVVGIGAAWLAFIQVFSELGFGAAIIQRPQVGNAHLSSTFYLNVGLGATLTVVGIACSGVVAVLFHTPKVQPVIAVLSVNYLINSFGLTHVSIAQRELRFKDLAVRDIGAALCGGVVGILLALGGIGVWSLVAQSLATSVSALVLIWRVTHWRPRLQEVSREALADLWGYGSKIFSFNILKYLSQNSDRLLVGYLLGPLPLGVYSIASRFVLTPGSAVAGAVGAYLFPQVSRIQDDVNAVVAAYLWTQRLINAVVVPTVVVIAVGAPVLVPGVLGDKWGDAVPLIQIFAFVAIAQAWFSLVGQLLKSLGRPGWLFNWSLAFAVVVVLCLWVGSRWGVLGVAVGLTVAYVIGVPINYMILRRLLPIGIADLTATVWATGLAAGVLGLSLWLSLGLEISPSSLRIGIGLAGGAALYIAILWRLDRDLVSGIWNRLAGV